MPIPNRSFTSTRQEHLDDSNALIDFYNAAGEDGAKVANVLAESVNVDDFAGADDDAKVAAALTAAGDDGELYFPGRDLTLSDPLTIPCNVRRHPSARILWAGGNAIAITLRTGSGTDRYQGKTAILPDIVQNTKTWSGTDVAYRVVNAYSSWIRFGHSLNFSNSILLTSFGTGNVYNHYFLGHSDNAKIGLKLDPGDATSWVNENNFYGGRISIASGEGTNIAGARHILIANGASTTAPPNNNRFFGTSIEGDGPEFHVECWGLYNRIVSGRWEATPPKVAFRAVDSSRFASHNLIEGGFNGGAIVFTEDADCRYNDHESSVGKRLLGTSTNQGITVANHVGATGPCYSVLASSATLSTNAATDYAVQLAQNHARFKAVADAWARIEILNPSGFLRFGSGAAEAAQTIRSFGGRFRFDGGGFDWATDNTYDIGQAATARPRDIHVGRDVVVAGALKATPVTTASLPAAGAAQDGRILIEDNGTGDRNLIIYAGGQRFRIDGGAAF